MTINKAVVAGIGLTLLTACTTLEERQRANGEYVYLGEPEGQPFAVPQDLDTPNYNAEYDSSSIR